MQHSTEVWIGLGRIGFGAGAGPQLHAREEKQEQEGGVTGSSLVVSCLVLYLDTFSHTFPGVHPARLSLFLLDAMLPRRSHCTVLSRGHEVGIGTSPSRKYIARLAIKCVCGNIQARTYDTHLPQLRLATTRQAHSQPGMIHPEARGQQQLVVQRTGHARAFVL